MRKRQHRATAGIEAVDTGDGEQEEALPWRRMTGLNGGQALATGATPAVNDHASAARGHPRQKAVLAFPADLRRLVLSFHVVETVSNGGRTARRAALRLSARCQGSTPLQKGQAYRGGKSRQAPQNGKKKR